MSHLGYETLPLACPNCIIYGLSLDCSLNRMRPYPRPVRQTLLDSDSPEVLASRELLSSLLADRELLLAAVLAGPTAWRNNCIKLFQGMRFTDDMIMSMFYYLDARKGPNPAYEYERCQEQRQEKENKVRAEAATLRELYALSRGKNREEEEAKIAKSMPAPESSRLPEIQKA